MSNSKSKKLKKQHERAKSRREVVKLKLADTRHKKSTDNDIYQSMRNLLAEILQSIGLCDQALQLINSLINMTNVIVMRRSGYHTDEWFAGAAAIGRDEVEFHTDITSIKNTLKTTAENIRSKDIAKITESISDVMSTLGKVEGALNMCSTFTERLIECVLDSDALYEASEQEDKKLILNDEEREMLAIYTGLKTSTTNERVIGFIKTISDRKQAERLEQAASSMYRLTTFSLAMHSKDDTDNMCSDLVAYADETAVEHTRLAHLAFDLNYAEKEVWFEKVDDTHFVAKLSETVDSNIVSCTHDEYAFTDKVTVYVKTDVVIDIEAGKVTPTEVDIMVMNDGIIVARTSSDDSIQDVGIIEITNIAVSVFEPSSVPTDPGIQSTVDTTESVEAGEEEVAVEDPQNAEVSDNDVKDMAEGLLK